VAEFELEPGAVVAVEDLLRETGQKVWSEANAASGTITGLRGSAWEGSAMNTAGNKQTGEFVPLASTLQKEIDYIAEALGLGRVQTLQEDADSASRIGQIQCGNWGRV
jgi:hypothetical protein